MKQNWPAMLRAAAGELAYVLLTGIIVVVPALMNGSPLVYSDSGTYMRVAFDIEPPTDRPVGYSLLIRATTWRATMWTIIYFQGAVVSWLLLEVLRQLFPNAQRIKRAHMLLLAGLVLLSSLPWYAAQVMPDILAGLLGILSFLLFCGRRLGKAKTILLWMLLFIFTISHYSFMAIMLGTAIGLLAARSIRTWRRAFAERFWRNWVGLLASTLAGILFVQWNNHQHGHGWVLSPTTDLFMASKLCESGVMYEHLKRTCPGNPRPVCARMDELDKAAWHFVWKMESPMRAGHSGLDDASQELKPLMQEIFHDPRNWGLLAASSINATLMQLLQFNIGSGITPYREDSAPWIFYRDKLRHELPMYMESRQQSGMLKFGALNALAGPVLLISLMIILFFWPVDSVRWQTLTALLLLTILLNAAATGALANVYDRLQARVTWLLPLLALLLLARTLSNSMRSRLMG